MQKRSMRSQFSLVTYLECSLRRREVQFASHTKFYIKRL
ncbi:MAG: hypothetical protein KatS3mg049_2589 [Caldilinea sp.]|jgi:hypothetical protein|nr:MAG: hypothetical protein KatS3mg049_2589 [Caldilinea sp.]